MSLLEQQNFLARVFTDESLRLSFWEDPEKTGAENGLDESDIEQLKSIVAADLNFFANSLFYKRLHEVERLLPLTKKALDKEFTQLFRQFSNHFQPKAVKKHLADAIEFCKFLQNRPIKPISAQDTAKFEQTKHLFFSREKYFAGCLLKHDIFSLKKKSRIAVWFRFGKNVRHFIW